MNKRSFQAKLRHHKRPMTLYLRRLERHAPHGLDKLAVQMDKQTWEEVHCLSCANCCKVMTPTFNPQDIDRISAHLGMEKEAFIKTYLKYDKKDKDWQNQIQPCQWLDLETNMCSIYEVRPDDCAGFPHLTKAPMTDYMHVHKQNINYCPATFTFVQKLMTNLPL